jgi:hypothetical protein
MDDLEILALIEQEESAAYGVNDTELAHERSTAIDYYLGEPYGNEVEGRSQVVTTEVQDTIEAALPQLLKIFVSGDEIVRFDPKHGEDIPGAEQETEYINHVVMEKNNGYLVFYTWIKDALLSKNGYVKVYYEEENTVEEESYKGLTDGQLQQMASDQNIQILEHDTYQDTSVQIPPELIQAAEMGDPQAQQMLQQIPMLHDVKISVSEYKGKICILNVAPENMKVSVDTPTTDLQKARFVQHSEYKSRADLEAEGFTVPDGLENSDHRYEEESLSRDLYDEQHNLTDNNLILVKDTYMKVDGKLTRFVVAGNTILLQEEADIVPFCCITPHLMPHRHIGRSYADLTMTDQLTSSTLMRGLLDAMYLANQPRFAISDRVNLEDMLVSRPGGVVRVTGEPSAAILPLLAQPPSPITFNLIELLNANREKRTGVTSYNQGLDADSLNKTKGGMQMIMNAAQERLLNVARLFAETGVKDLFMMVHRLVRTNYTKPDIVRLRNEWVEVDPRQWKTRTDMTITVGLGTGNKDQQLQHLMTMLQVQEKALMIGVATPKNIYHSCIKLSQNAGFKDAEEYFTDPTTQPPKEPPPDPKVELEKAKLQMDGQKFQAEQAWKERELQLKTEGENLRLQLEAEKERNKSMMDMQERQHEAELKAQLELNKTQLERERLAFEQWKVEFTEQNKIVLQQMSEAHQTKQASISANQANPDGATEMDETGQSRPTPALQALVEAVNVNMASAIETLSASQSASNQQIIKALSKPKQVIRGADGRVTGVA